LLSFPGAAAASLVAGTVSVAIHNDNSPPDDDHDDMLFVDKMHSSELIDGSPNSISSTITPTTLLAGLSPGSSSPNIPSSGGPGLANPTSSLSRVDFPYPINFLKQHIEAMQNFFAEIGTLRAEGEAWLRQGNQFRPSTMKKEMKVQFFPTNLHIQLMCVRYHEQGGNGDGQVDCVDSITSGCMSPHGLGHKKGGLTVLEDELLKQKMKIDSLKDRYSTILSRRPASQCLSPHGSEAELLDEIGKNVMNYEGACMNIGKRRVFALSQAVSTAATAFMLKLCLVLEGHIDASVAEKWLTIGFLIVFEGLLSVSGKEKSMLEDTQSAVDSLKLFQVRLLPSPSITSSQSASMYSSSTLTGQSIFSDVLDVGFSGREIRIYLPPTLVARLPLAYKQRVVEAGAVVSLVPVLFTQVCVKYSI
jgi:hypothetical protein